MTEYRVSWEMPPPTVVAYDYEDVYGRDVWKRLTPRQWGSLPWRTSENITDNHDDAHDQYATLKGWAETHEQPIRNVTIEERPSPAPNEGWVTASERTS
jgi:hypothetical protein